MAIVGDLLTAPESGWKRIDDTNSNIVFGGGTWTALQSDANYYNSTNHYLNSNNMTEYFQFKFKGSKFRIIGTTNGSMCNNCEVVVDGVVASPMSLYNINLSGSASAQRLVYEVTGLSDALHIIKVTKKSEGYFGMDAIDIDATGNVYHIKEKLSLSEMVVGDFISCEYAAPVSGSVGTFGNFGAASKSLIPVASSATPDGSFYWVMVGYDTLGRKKFIADRNIQHSIAWDTLNTAGLTSGLNYTFKSAIVPNMTSNTAPSGIASASAEPNSNQGAYKAFNGTVADSADKYYSGVTPAAGSPVTVQYQSLTPKVLCSYKLTPGCEDGYGVNRMCKTWTVDGSNNGIDWTVLDSRNNVTDWTKSVPKEYTVSNTTLYSYYRLSVTEIVSAGEVFSIGDIQFYEVNTELSKNNFVLRLPTGGISATDKDNEWDKIIVESTLNGTMVAGDNNVWNWSGIASNTSTVISGTNTSRVIRGNSAANTHSSLATATVNTTTGFRPVLFVEQAKNIKYFFKCSNGDILTYNNGWTAVGNGEVTTDMVNAQGGLTNLTSITDAMIDALPTDKFTLIVVNY